MHSNNTITTTTTDEDYHNDTNRVSSTQLRKYTTYAAAKAHHHTTTTTSMTFGKAIHSLILGAGPTVTTWEHDGRTKAGKEEREHHAEAITKNQIIVVTPTQLQTAHNMAEAFHAHKPLTDILNPAQTETTINWEENNTPAKARIDILTDTAAFDYKTCGDDATSFGFGKAMATYGYHQQADWYLRGLRAVGHPAGGKPLAFICQETSPPYLVQVHTPDQVAMLTACELNDRALRIIQQSTATGVWEGLEPLFSPPSPLPAYYFYQHEDQLDAGIDLEMVI